METLIRVALIEDDRRLRDSLSTLLAGSPGFSCIAVAGSVEEALRQRLAPPPDVLLLDIHLPGTPGSLGARLLGEKWPQAVILIHTVHEEDDKVFASLCNGAVGYILKRTPPARLLEAIREARDGGAPMSPEIARKVITLFRRIAPPAEPQAPLAPQELRLVGLLAQGHSYAGAAEELGVSLNTVRTYIRSVYEKLHVHTRSEAVSKALRSGLL
ncbi:MAG: response regulator [Thermoanaerobaculia bacterium]